MTQQITTISEMTWGQRLAVMQAYKLSEDQVCEAFHVTAEELATAIDLEKKGIFKIDTVMDVAPYGELFGADPIVRPAPKATGPSTKKVAEPKKRGRKGDKIQNAFAAVPVEPVSVESFMATHGVSLAVLRQSKRFDRTELAATRPVKVKKGKDGVLMISRPELGDEEQAAA